MGDAGATDPAAQVYPRGRLEGRGFRESGDGVRFSCTQSLGLKGFQENPDEVRMGPFPEVCPKGAEDRGGSLQGPRNLRHSPGSAAPDRERSLASKPQGV